uniref:Uncharacterized protein n=1 Tax=Hyaloperonospora arabidopsidis (strain Emoy2) TaxID=559515 RepID=M4C3Y5_HYAAE
MWMVRYQAHRANLLVYAEDLTHFAQTIKIHLGQGKHSERRFCEHGRFSVAQKDTYLLWVWRGRTHQGKLSKQEDCQHVRMPSGSKTCGYECCLEDGELVELSRVGNIALTVVAEDYQRDIDCKGFGIVYDGVKSTPAPEAQ